MVFQLNGVPGVRGVPGVLGVPGLLGVRAWCTWCA